MKVRYTLSIGYQKASQSDEVDLPDDYTDEQIEEDYQCWCSNYLDGGWSKVDEEPA